MTKRIQVYIFIYSVCVCPYACPQHLEYTSIFSNIFLPTVRRFVRRINLYLLRPKKQREVNVANSLASHLLRIPRPNFQVARERGKSPLLRQGILCFYHCTSINPIGFVGG